MPLALLANLKWLLAFVAVVGVSLFSLHGLLPDSGYQVVAPMESADGLYVGSDVLIAGSRAGTVQDIQLRNDLAMVTLSILPAHAPLHLSATVSLRPKSLLGEKYIDLNPGRTGDTFRSGAELPKTSVTRATDLEEVINTFDQPTREKLQTVIIELGGGLAGRGADLNETLRLGTTDLKDLRTVADQLARHDKDLQTVIDALDTVTTELARSDRRQQLGALIQNSDRLLKNLADQDAALKRALEKTNAALSRTDTALTGTGGNLADIFRELPVLVDRTNSLTRDLATGNDAVLANMSTSIQSIKETEVVFGGKDGNGYATRITVLAGIGSAGVGATSGSLATAPVTVGTTSAATSDSDIYRFLLGLPPA